MHRRCNYNREVAVRVEGLLYDLQDDQPSPIDYETMLGYYIQQWERSGMADAVILPHITPDNYTQLPQALAEALLSIVRGMLQYQPFELVTIHDEFKCHPNHANWMRWQYKEILAEMAESRILEDILSQLYHEPVTYGKLSFNLAAQIRNSNYALC